MNRYAPIALFVYNRLECLKKTIEALSKNFDAGNTEMFVFSDGAKNPADVEKVNAVRIYLEQMQKTTTFKYIYVECAIQNRGLANSIISGVTKILNEYGRVIVLEDDIITAPDFISYMNGALSYYEKDKRVGSVSAYTYPIKSLNNYSKDVYFTYKGDCWGWGTWKDRWEEVDWTVSDYRAFYNNYSERRKFASLEYGLVHMLDMQMAGCIDSWAIRWCYHLFKRKLLTVYPRHSIVNNIGVDGSGEHCKFDLGFSSSLQPKTIYHFENPIVDEKIAKEAGRYCVRTPILWIYAHVIRVLFRLGIKI